MQKVIISLSLLLISISFSKCGPAAEDRFIMKENAKKVSDSIGKAVDEALAKGAIPENTSTAVVDTVKK